MSVQPAGVVWAEAEVVRITDRNVVVRYAGEPIPPDRNPYDIAGHALMVNSFPVALFVGDTCEETSNLLGHPIGNYGVLVDHECQFFA